MMIDVDVALVLRNLQQQIEIMNVTLERIAKALDRMEPIPEPRNLRPSKPADLEDLTVVTPALRHQWAEEAKHQADLTRDLPSSLKNPSGFRNG